VSIKLNHGGPAFPSKINNDYEIAFFPGMTLRDWFAGQALAGMLASRNPLGPRFHPADDAAYVYAVADAMLAAREVKHDP